MVKATEKPRGSPKRILFSCGVGSFCNDIISKVQFAFSLVFFTKVADLSNEQAGYVFAAGQAINVLGNFVFGYCCDHISVPVLSRKYGKRKTWHLIGTVFTVSFFVLSFSRCLLCPDPPSTGSWLGFGYYAVVFGVCCFWWGAVDVAHLPLIPEIAKTQSEIVILNSIRAGFSYLGGICTYGIAWIVLGRSSHANLTSSDAVEFTKITTAMSAIGLVFVVIFGVGTPEVKGTKTQGVQRKKSSILPGSGVFSVSTVYAVGSGNEEAVEEGCSSGGKKSSVMSVLRKTSTYMVPFNPEMLQDVSNHDSTQKAVGSRSGNTQEDTGLSQSPSLGKNQDLRLKSAAFSDDKRPPSPEISSDEERGNKSVKAWLKDARLYKVTAIFTCAYSVENIALSYLAFYVMDYLRFEKEASAYFPLVFLVSGICGCAVSKKLDNVVGRKWTFCGFSVLAMTTATCFYFITESTKQAVYAPVVLIGCCSSSLIVMGLSYLGDLVGNQKESAGFVFAFASAVHIGATGILLVIIQSFYPSGSDAGCPECGDYVRTAYPLSLGALSLAGLLLVLFCSDVRGVDCCTTQRGRTPPVSGISVTTPPAADASVPRDPGTLTEANGWETRL